VGTGLCFALSPECFLAVFAPAGTCFVLLAVRRACAPRGCREILKDCLAAVLLVSAVGLLAGMRTEARASRFQAMAERVAVVRGSVIGFPQPSKAGTNLLVSSIGEIGEGSLCAPLRKGTRVLVRAKVKVGVVCPGDTLTLAGLLRSPISERNPGSFSEAAYLFVSGVNAVLSVPGFLEPRVNKVDPPRGFVATYMSPVHGWLRNGINRNVPGDERGFLLALVLGERGELSEEMKDAFRDSGIIHLISVSGLHTALVGMIGFLFLKGIRVPLKASLVGSALIVWFYCGISGCSPPTLRSSVMVSCVVTSRLLGRGTGLASPLCLSCALLLLANPGYLLDVGFQLSYAATGSMIAAAPLGRLIRERLNPPDWLYKYVISTIMTTIVAQLGVLPILALQFGSVSAVSIPANLLAIPIASGALVSSFCSLGILAAAPLLAGPCFSLTWLLLRLCNLVAKVASSIPGATMELVKPSLAQALVFMVCFFVLLGSFDVATHARSERARAKTRRGMRVRLSILVLSGAGVAILALGFAGMRFPWANSGCGFAEVRFLDVGQGDATALTLPTGKLILVDGGESVENWDSAERVLVPFLRNARRKAFDKVLVTHFHSDHVGGVMKLLDQGKVKELLVCPADTTTALSQFTRALARKKNVGFSFVSRPDTILNEDGVLVTVLHPSRATSLDTSFASVNDSSMVLAVSYRGAQFVLTGDASPNVMDRVAEALRPAKLTVLKAPHHGGKGTLSFRCLERARPDYVVLSVGRNNRFGHPAKEIVESYKENGARIFRTDKSGSVYFRLCGDSIEAGVSDPVGGLPMIEKMKSRRGARKLFACALFSGASLLGRFESVL